jgi:hypothetical protein
VAQPDLDPITGPAPSTLTTALLAERLASERALREQSLAYERELRQESRASNRLLAEQMARSHDSVHKAESQARDKAESAVDKRLEGMNEFRDQLRTQAATFLTIAVFDAHWKDLGTQLAEIKTGIIDLQKTDLGSASRSSGLARGQGMVIAAIITSITVASIILGLIIAISNALTT